MLAARLPRAISLQLTRRTLATAAAPVSSLPNPPPAQLILASQYNRTPLYDFHTLPEHGGKMVEFAGFEMPLSYNGKVGESVAGGPVAEHHQVRNSSGLFDVGHMVQSTYTGPGALGFLSRVLPSSLSTLPIPTADGDSLRSTLSVLLNPEGGIIDDCMVTRWGAEKFYLVTNAGRAERDMAWLKLNVELWNGENKDQVKMEIMSGWGLIALQGPKSHEALARLLPPSFPLSSLHFGSSTFASLSLGSSSSPAIHIARGGYTGEDGFEISIPAALTHEISQRLLDQPEVKLAGLAARDSLRLEAGLCLYGHDLDEGTGVGEAGLAWVVGKDRREAGSFIGSERTLAELKKGGTIRKRIGITVEKGAPAREGAKIFTADGSKEIGIVTSGLPSPTVGQNISMGYIQTADGYNKKGTEVLVEVRKKMRKGTVTSMPWITPGYYRG